MQPNTKKYLIAGAIGLVSITAAIAFLQYKKIMNYVIKFKKMKVNNASLNNVNLDLFLLFTNKSDIKFEIKEQDYKVYINNVFVTKIVNYSSNTIEAKQTSDIAVNVNFDPKKLFDTVGRSLLDVALSSKDLKIKLDIKLKVSIWGFSVGIPYIYETTLKQILAAKKEKV